MRLRITTLLIGALLLAACGSHAATPRARPVSLILDFTPNAVHAGIYSALAHRYDRANRLRLNVIAPGASTDSIKLLETGRVDFAILDIHDLAIARESNPTRPRLVGIMAIVERPLAAVLAAPAIRTPRQLQNRLVGVTGVPSDTAVLRSIVTGAGGDPSRVKTITIGFNAVPDLLASRVSAATAFWNDEGVALAAQRPGFHSFRAEEYGAPPYPELILTATARTLREHPAVARALTRTLVEGYDFTLAHPGRSASDLERLVAGLNPKLVRTQLNALLGAFRGPRGRVGELDPGTLRRWAAWEARFGIVKAPPDVAALFDAGFQ
jgi:NitT/TauT family transport system substrate-binding protein/putative hydroxymethylpyrimidine transport system substrate-binding protein